MPPASAFQLNGFTALVTGAGRGLGADIATALARSGAVVYAMSRSAGELDQLVAKIRADGGRAEAAPCDVTDAAAVQRIINGMPRVDILVNNAGTNYPGPFVDATPEQLDAMWLLNVRATFSTAQACARRMIADGNPSGSIINISSQLGHVGAANRSIYSMTKHAVEGLTKAMALELALQNIRVNTVAPTFVETPMTESFFSKPGFRDWVMTRLPMGRLLPSEDVANAVCYLASDMASMITGTSLRLDGGWTAQ